MNAEHQTFLLSPADCGGPRAARLLTRLKAAQTSELSLGDGFREISALYFRGKLEYARRFARPRPGQVPVWVITPTRGIRPVTDRIDAALLEEFGTGTIREDHAEYRKALDAGLARLQSELGPTDRVIFLGSLASKKYVEALLAVEEHVVVPAAFRGVGNMRRGSLLIKTTRDDEELSYVPLADVA